MLKLRKNLLSNNYVHQLFIFEAVQSPTSPLVDLREHLQISLRSTIEEKSLKTIKSKKKTFEIARAAAVLFFIVGIIFIVVTYLLFQVHNEETNDLGNGWRQTSTWVSSIAILLSMGSLFILNRLSQEVFNPLHADGQNIFQNEEMLNLWLIFFNWAKRNEPTVYIKQRDGRHRKIKNVWKSIYSEVFILGSNEHRHQLVSNRNQLTSQLMISEEDWAAFEGHLHQKQDNQEARHETSDPTDKYLSLRQKVHGKGTKMAPRFELLLTHPHFNNRYPDNVKFKSDEANEACHKTLIFILENQESKNLFKILGANNGKPKTDAQKSFLKNLEIRLGISGKANSSRLDYALKLQWNKMETFLEDLDIISDAELIEFHPDFQKESDSPR